MKYNFGFLKQLRGQNSHCQIATLQKRNFKDSVNWEHVGRGVSLLTCLHGYGESLTLDNQIVNISYDFFANIMQN